MEEYSYTQSPKRSKSVVALNIVLSVIIAILIVVIILLTTTLTTITVSGNSMYPTLSNGDKLILLRRGYKLNRGDIVVFADEDANKVKRILGLEGDVIRFDLKDMTWVVNGTPYAEEYVKEGYSDNYWNISDDSVKAAIFSSEGLVVEQGCLFVLGDNRNSHDSKVSVDSHVSGAIQAASVIGKVIKIY